MNLIPNVNDLANLSVTTCNIDLIQPENIDAFVIPSKKKWWEFWKW